VPSELDGTRGEFRAPPRRCLLSARNDYDAVQAWLALHESPVTQRAYRKEAERLMLWAIIERGKALSSARTEDAIAYRTFLRHPTPKRRWIGPAAPRTSPQWRPFQGPLKARSVGYALSVVSALFRWLIEQRYLVANPFAGVRVRAAAQESSRPGSRAFSEHEWALIRPLADRLEDAGWTEPAAQRLRFVLDFAYATGLRSSELVGATLGQISQDDRGDRWIDIVGKGSKAGRVVVPARARLALDRHLAARGISTLPERWPAGTPLLPRLSDDGARLTGARLWVIMKRFFQFAADELEDVNRSLADKLRRASPHWMRHTHATHALGKGASLTTVRDNLRHASVSTTSVYLHTDEARRARELAGAFGVPQRATGGVKPGQTARRTKGSRKARTHK
jgi:site-specific recombinase XerD